jgi:hypothetical protein
MAKQINITLTEREVSLILCALDAHQPLMQDIASELDQMVYDTTQSAIDKLWLSLHN